jgi:beta propeller repeat protein
MSRGKLRCRFLLLSLLTLTAIALSTTSAFADWFLPEQSVPPATDGRRDISGTNVVYSWGTDVYVYDLASGSPKRITTRTGEQTYPTIDGTKVVYEDVYRPDDRDIYFYDLATSTERQIDASTDDTVRPVVRGGRVVYYNITRARFYMYDLSTSAKTELPTMGGLTPDGNLHSPLVYGNGMVYRAVFPLGDTTREVHFLDLSSLADRPLFVGTPARLYFHGANVVYSAENDGNQDVYVYDLNSNTTRRITTSYRDDLVQGIWGNWVLFLEQGDQPLDNNQLLLFDLSTNITRAVPTPETYINDAWISDKAIVWAGLDTGAIRFAYPKITLTNKIGPVTYGGSVVARYRLVNAAGAPMGSVPVTLQESIDGLVWASKGTTRTAGDGSFKFIRPGLTARRFLRAKFAGNYGFLPTVSSSLTVKPTARLTRTSSWGVKYDRKTYYYYGYIEPKHAPSDTNKVKFLMYKKASNGVYRWKKTVTTSYSYIASQYPVNKSRWKAKVIFPSSGKWRVRAYHAGDSLNASTYSSYDYVTVK